MPHSVEFGRKPTTGLEQNSIPRSMPTAQCDPVLYSKQGFYEAVGGKKQHKN